MDHFEALMQSLLEQCVDYIGKDHLDRLAIWPQPELGTCHIEICLTHDTWEERERAIDKMIEVRGMFMDEISIEYAFTDGSCTDYAPAETAEYAFA